MSGSWRRSRQKQDGGDDEAADDHGVEQDGDGQAESELLEMRSSLRTKAKLGARDGPKPWSWPTSTAGSAPAG